MTFVLGAAVVVTLILVAVEFVAGYFGHSISLVSDAVHNLTDVPAMFISWLATRWAQKPPTQEHTYGFRRAGILAAFTNALFLAAVALFIVYEGYRAIARAGGSGSGSHALGGAVRAPHQRRNHVGARVGAARPERS